MIEHVCHRHQSGGSLLINCNSEHPTLHKNADCKAFLLGEIKLWVQTFQELVPFLVSTFSCLCFRVKVSSFDHVHHLLIKHDWEFVIGLRHGVEVSLEPCLWLFPLCENVKNNCGVLNLPLAELGEHCIVVLLDNLILVGMNVCEHLVKRNVNHCLSVFYWSCSMDSSVVLCVVS